MGVFSPQSFEPFTTLFASYLSILRCSVETGMFQVLLKQPQCIFWVVKLHCAYAEGIPQAGGTDASPKFLYYPTVIVTIFISLIFIISSKIVLKCDFRKWWFYSITGVSWKPGRLPFTLCLPRQLHDCFAYYILDSGYTRYPIFL